MFSVNWATTLQQEIPPEWLSRVASYDALGAFVLAPAGTAAAGQLASTFGTRTILNTSAALTVILSAAVLVVPEIRQIRRHQAAPADPADEAASSDQPVP